MNEDSSRNSPPEVFLGKGVLKICSKFAGEYPCRSMISIKLLCIISEHLLLRTHLEDNFSSSSFVIVSKLVFQCSLIRSIFFWKRIKRKGQYQFFYLLRIHKVKLREIIS